MVPKVSPSQLATTYLPTSYNQCWAKSQEQCQRSGWVGTFAGQGGGQPELIPARFSYQPESSRFIFFEPAIYIVYVKNKGKKKFLYIFFMFFPFFCFTFPPLFVFLPLCRRLISCYSLLARCSLLVAHCSLLIARCRSSFLLPSCSLTTACYSLFIHCSLLTAHSSLLLPRWLSAASHHSEIAARHSLIAARHSSPIIRHSALTTRRFARVTCRSLNQRRYPQSSSWL